MARDEPSGWTAASGVLEPSDLVAGYAARVQPVKGVCRNTGCRRTVELDPKALCDMGYGRIPMRKLQELWRCHRLEGCGLSFHKEPAQNPLRLGQLVGRPNVRVRLSCQGAGCKFFRVWTVEEMIAGLEKRGQGDERTDCDTLGYKMTAGCPVCKKVNWKSDIAWVNTESAGWKAQGERTFGPQGNR